jgi:hypothetical protein
MKIERNPNANAASIFNRYRKKLIILYKLKETQMIKIQKMSKAFILLLVVAGLFACNDDDNTAEFEVIGDVFVTKKMMNDEDRYAPSYYAYGTHPMTAAKATTPDDTEITLEAAPGVSSTWLKVPEEEDYTTNIPDAGTYKFTVTHEAVEHETTDALSYEDLEYTDITSKEMSSGVLTLKWEAAPEADGHMVRLLNPTGDIVFGSAFVLKQGTQLEIGPNNGTGTWLNGYPNTGEEYKLELHAFAFESNAPDNQTSYHIQEVSITQDTVTWE